jgi:hypothetical protein
MKNVYLSVFRYAIRYHDRPLLQVSCGLLNCGVIGITHVLHLLTDKELRIHVYSISLKPPCSTLWLDDLLGSKPSLTSGCPDEHCVSLNKKRDSVSPVAASTSVSSSVEVCSSCTKPPKSGFNLAQCGICPAFGKQCTDCLVQHHIKRHLGVGLDILY